jgi:RNA polymerase sigma-70 factor (ECF subfamily)
VSIVNSEPARHLDTVPGACAGAEPATVATGDWIATLVRVHRVRLLALARRASLSADEAFDCVQQAFQPFIALPQARALADRPDEAGRLLGTVVRNAARTVRRRAAVARCRHAGAPAVEAVAARGDGAEEQLADAEAQHSLRQCVLGLDALQRAVVTLRMLDELSGDEVAAALGISAQHVAVVLHRAKARLRGCMAAAGHCPRGGDCAARRE